MKVARLHAIRDIRLHDEPAPAPGPHDELIRVTAAGICGSDLHWYAEGSVGTASLTRPLVLGHEFVGVIASGKRKGQRVVIEPSDGCGVCELCHAGHPNLCQNGLFAGYGPTDGCFRDYITWPARLCLRVPDSLSFDEAAMTEPLAIGVYAVELAEPKPTDVAAILGAGAIGLSVLQAAKICGARRIIVSEPIPERREMASRLGASEVIDPSATDSDSELKRLTNGRGADIVYECTGEDDATREASRMASIMGKVVVAGIPDCDEYRFDASAARRKELRAVFVRRSNLTTEKAIEWVAERKADVACFATHRFPLERAEEAMKLAIEKADGVVRAVVEVSR